MRIAIAGFMHESNTFNPNKTTRAAFEEQGLVFGKDVYRDWGNGHHELAGYFAALEGAGDEALPIVMAWAMPAGPVVAAVFDEVTGRIIDDLKRLKPNGLLMGLHGAMVAESHLDADGEVLHRLRQAMGPSFPIVASFDLHGNTSQKVVDNCNALVSYRTNPHVDQKQTGTRAAALLHGILKGKIRPTQALAKPDCLINIMVQDTSKDPLKSIMDEVRALENKPGILAASLLPGFAYSDVPQIGPAIIVVTDNDPALARREADGIANRIWQARESLSKNLPEADQAIAQALKADKLPVVLVDPGDNIGGGSSADGTALLAEMLRQGATDGVVCLNDPEAVKQCIAAGVGKDVELRVGGKADTLQGPPVAVKGRVRVLHDGNYVELEARHGGKRYNHMGLTALVEIPGPNHLVLTSQRHPPFSLHQLTCLGLDPKQQRMLVVKAAIAYKAAYLPIAGTIIEVDTPGWTAVNPHRFTYKHIRHPMYPLDR